MGALVRRHDRDVKPDVAKTVDASRRRAKWVVKVLTFAPARPLGVSPANEAVVTGTLDIAQVTWWCRLAFGRQQWRRGGRER